MVVRMKGEVYILLAKVSPHLGGVGCPLSLGSVRQEIDNILHLEPTIRLETLRDDTSTRGGASRGASRSGPARLARTSVHTPGIEPHTTRRAAAGDHIDWDWDPRSCILAVRDSNSWPSNCLSLWLSLCLG